MTPAHRPAASHFKGEIASCASTSGCSPAIGAKSSAADPRADRPKRGARGAATEDGEVTKFTAAAAEAAPARSATADARRDCCTMADLLLP
mmetsp:Transcript_42220/g.107315  ORF Transcript_42220/g.107315 Transcript_42220/m.107315 type:complete len:91 (+) Transcript_42220:113-385(+)